MFANPALDHRGNRLHRALHVDSAALVTHRLHLFGEFGAEAIAGEADDAHAVDGTFDLPEQTRQRRIGARLAAEKCDLDAAAEVLIDQHGDMLAAFQRFRESQRRIAPGRNQRPHLHLPDLLDDPVGGGDVGPAVEDRRIEPMGHRGKRRYFPVGEVACKDQRGLAVQAELLKQLVCALG